ncbi:hypothetical protein [Streptomyces violascens]|uniref:hypothetical protein n=1 Tax=Streptomyces violascens TaxID=67381 RepID=UPI0036744E9C
MAQCEVCGTELVQGRGRPRHTCSGACRQEAHRRRRAAEVQELRAAAARTADRPSGSSCNEPDPRELGPDGLPDGIRAAWLSLGEMVEWAARRARADWAESEIAPGLPALTPEGAAESIRYRAAQLADAVLATVKTSRNESAAPAPAAEITAPEPAAPGPARDTPASARPRRMSAKKAREVAAGAQLVSADRATYSYEVVAADGGVLGHVAPAYKAGRRSGWQGWAAGLARPSSPHRHSNRDGAGADALGQWIRIVTAKSA